MNEIENTLSNLGIQLPRPGAAVANYLPYTVSGTLVFVSGQLSKLGDVFITGRLGQELTVEEGYNAARLCGINLLSHIKHACDGDLSRVVSIVKIGGFVAATPQDTDADIPQIINGCSDLFVDVFGTAGRHARFAVGVSSLPLNAAVEIDAIVEISP